MRRYRAWVCDGVLLFLTLLLAACNGAATPTTAPAAATAPFASAAPTMTRATTIPSATIGAMGAMGAMGVMARADVPAKVYDTLRYIQTHNGDSPPGYVGDTVFDNRERRLPQGRYKEYDVDPKMAGVGRNAERLVINQDTGQAYYTADHYVTFILVTAGR